MLPVVRAMSRSGSNTSGVARFSQAPQYSPRTSRVIGNKSPRQRRLAGPGFSCECNDSSPTQGRQLKCALQPGELFVAFKQIGIETGHESQSDSVAALDRLGTVMPPT